MSRRAPRAQQIFGYLRTSLDQPVVRLEDAVVDAIGMMVEEPLSDIQALELAEDRLDTVRELIDQHASECASAGIAPDLKFGADRNTLVNNRANLALARQQFSDWLRVLTPFDFEHLCRVILELEGCGGVQVTSQSGDGGIDFYGFREVIIAGERGPGLFQSTKVLVVGQAKLYTASIGIAPLREFLGSAALITLSALRNAPAAVTYPMVTSDYRPLGPTLMVFVTSSEANQSTLEVARWLGVRLIGARELFDILESHDCGVERAGSIVTFNPELLTRSIALQGAEPVPAEA
jgi:hypothetical protein